MSTPKTKEEIATEIATLKEMKPRVRRTTAFGDDNHYAIDGQIQALETDMDENAIYDEHDNAAEDELFADDNVVDAAIQAAQWSNGEENISPSESWKPLCK